MELEIFEFFTVPFTSWFSLLVIILLLTISSMHNELYHSSHVLVHYLQADTAGQRGFRRRCLDFDVARRKSFGSMGGRKSLGSRLKDCSGIDGNNTSVLGDGMRPASDATRTRVQIHVDASRTATDSVMHTGGESCTIFTYNRTSCLQIL